MLIIFVFIILIIYRPKSLLVAPKNKVKKHNVTECQLGAGQGLFENPTAGLK